MRFICLFASLLLCLVPAIRIHDEVKHIKVSLWSLNALAIPQEANVSCVLTGLFVRERDGKFSFGPFISIYVFAVFGLLLYGVFFFTKDVFMKVPRDRLTSHPLTSQILRLRPLATELWNQALSACFQCFHALWIELLMLDHISLL